MTIESPDRSVCRNCEQPISWDDWCYTHDANGMADCGVRIVGGIPVGLDGSTGPMVVIDPAIVCDLPTAQRTRAEPVEWGTK